MTQEEMLEGNKLIAKFMGATNGSIFCQLDEKHLNLDYDTFPQSKQRDDGSMWNINDLKYHTSWNWLMPVVEKIENTTCHEYYGYTMTIWNNCCKISDENNEYEINSHFHPDSKLLATWGSVVEFIKWYNNQNK
jgi:hypothetical protein